jgi:GT2 family glycosyltransferase/glycosyltransferase involved in cell wall biosynthesis
MRIKNAVCYSFSLTGEDPMAHLRLIGPLRQSGINIINGIENDQIIINRVSEGDMVIIQREFPKNFESYEQIIEIARKEEKPVVYDLDDLLLYLPENHPDRQSAYYSSSLLPMFQALMEADLVSVSTPKLRDFVINYNANVAVLPNYFDDHLWQLKPPVLKTSEHEPLTIGYMGGNSHTPDIEYITPVLLDLIKRYPKKIRFQFWGLQPPDEVGSFIQVQWSPVPSYRYKDFATFFQTQTADIFIAPLIDNLFNRCKSPIKFFEYGALGVPGVFSRLETYTDVITHGHNGLLAASLDEWTNCLIQLIEDEELRFHYAKNAQETIRSNWLLSQNSYQWPETYQSVSAKSTKDGVQKDKILNIIKSTNHQLLESALLKESTIQTLDAQVAELSVQVAEKEQSIQVLNARLLEIFGSRAWRIVLLISRMRLRLFPHGSFRERSLLFFFQLISNLFLQPLRKIRTFLVRSRESMRIKHLQIFLMNAKNRLFPEIRLLNSVSKKVSIIIPNYNGQKYLGDCIESLNQLNFPREQYEIIVVDNASIDNSREFIISTYPEVVLIQPERNLGFTGGCNLGIKNSRGEYVVLLNNDTVVDVNWLKELVAIADSDKEIAIVGSKLLFKHNPNEIQNAGSYLTSNGDGGDIGFRQPDEGQYDTTRETMAACGASMLVRRTLIEEIGALDEDFVAYYEDTDFCYRTRLYGRKIVIAPKSIVYHVHAATSKEWSPFFTFSVFRNKLLMHLKNSRSGFLLKVLFLYCSQIIYDGLIRGINRKTHIKVLASFAKKLPRFLIKRFYVRFIVKRERDSRVLLRLTKVKPRVNTSSVKKVCIYNAYLPTMGGGENLTAHIIAYINSIFPSASIDILCHETEAFDNSRFAGKEFIQMLEREFNLSLKNTVVRFVNINLNNKNIVGRMRNIHKLSSITKEYDLFINNTYSSSLQAHANVNIYSCMFPSKFEHSGTLLMRLYRRLSFNRFLKSYDIFLAISQYTQKWIDNYWKVNSFVLYPPIQTLRTSINQHKENIVINVGRFFASGHNKKQDVMVKAFIEMYDKGWARDWKLILVGRKHTDEASSIYTQSLEEVAKGYPIELRYDINIGELQNLLDRAKVYWHATGYGENPNTYPEKFEHFGLSTIEAAQFGTVPIVFNAGGQPEIIAHAKNGFLWDTTDELIEYSKLLMENDSVWNDLSRATFDSMEIFSEEKQLHWFVLFLNSYYMVE